MLIKKINRSSVVIQFAHLDIIDIVRNYPRKATEGRLETKGIEPKILPNLKWD